MERQTLDAIGLRYGTDKSSQEHNYLHFYEELFSPWRDSAVNIVELGCWTGASLNMFAEYFPRAAVIGVDQNTERVEVLHESITVVQSDALDRDTVGRLLQKHPPTILIDDASHKWSHQTNAFEYYFPYVRPGGWFICEDVHTSFGDGYAHAYGDQALDAASYFAILALAACGMRGTMLAPHKLPYSDGHVRLAKFVDRVIFRYHCVAVKKKER